MSLKYLFTPIGFLIHLFYALGLLILPFAFIYTILGPGIVVAFIISVIIAVILAAIQYFYKKYSRFNDGSKDISSTRRSILIGSVGTLSLGAVIFAVKNSTHSIGDTQEIGGLEITVTRAYTTGSIETGEGEVVPMDLTGDNVTEDLTQFVVILVDVDQTEDATAYNDRVSETSLLHNGSVYFEGQPVVVEEQGVNSIINEVKVEDRFLTRFGGSADRDYESDLQVVTFPIESSDLSNYGLKMERNGHSSFDSSRRWQLTPEE
ncbi:MULTISPECIES: DUF4199 domain-containing protein [Halomicrobium]|uniref:Uncharacterized protein n=2 Tax=Halomicrobium mukohataei TaxID=57705 RepID=C7NXZ1_HALMD|nr:MULTISPECIES: DUF4199 domain-containing protein [Halomicrobium]ACV46579.1 hypothetical protein Hmuk_0445 [Halomicrobium mukohataei DSM 12286]QCD65119.1 DUF4199 domain-containing protein [Halomicrobium mukohataei]QFR19925.1 DUF4199 domain-containing protein [Halomicrobium sp. ZPS1]